ncbi:MAG: hypothetical protein EHM58_11005 [Ignavibacteriae bacterium]|nr:MAG: hypothetical protein EHM58_11005 [Ignavibacteriota bacterium]
MNFKKDYINYVLHNVLQSDIAVNITAKKVLERVITTNDFFKITFVIGKTAGLELLFKYLLYISDKVDKSQITIFNLKDNFEYDVNNMKRICTRLQIKEIPVDREIDTLEIIGNGNSELETTEIKDEVLSETTDETTDETETGDETEEVSEEDVTESGLEDEGMSLLENKEQDSAGSQELFELESISRTIETHITESKKEIKDSDNEEAHTDENIAEKPVLNEEVIEDAKETIENVKEDSIEKDNEEEPELQIEVRKPSDIDEYLEKEEIKDEASEQDEFNKFEHRYREEIKILEKLLSYIEKECTYNGFKGLNERTLKSFNEIIEISNGLGELTRQLSFDLVADIFFTINMYFKKASSNPTIITLERIKLFDSSLAIVSSLIKGETYLDYDEIITKVESLKVFLAKPFITQEEKSSSVKPDKAAEGQEISAVKRLIESPETIEFPKTPEAEEVLIEKPKVKKQSAESIIFKMKYLVKEFEKNFSALENIKGEYSKFAALEKVDELNYYLRMLAKIASAVKLNDILKLAEVSYVFLKYLKDYRMDLLDSEIKQIIKYIIFTFKMLLTDRKPEDFNVLVQYLNNPVKIFADSN